jgi:hypothetical protein
MMPRKLTPEETREVKAAAKLRRSLSTKQLAIKYRCSERSIHRAIYGRTS